MRKIAFAAAFLCAMIVASNIHAEVIVVAFNNASADDGTIDGASETFTVGKSLNGATFDIVVTAMRTADDTSLIESGGKLGQQGPATGEEAPIADSPEFNRLDENTIINIAIDNFDPVSSGLTETDIFLSARLLKFAGAADESDSGLISTINSPNELAGKLIWTANNGGATFAGYDRPNSTIDLFTANSDNAVTQFKHDFLAGSWTIESLGVEFSNISAVPEPSSVVVCAAILGFGWCSHRRRKSRQQKLAV